MKIICYSLRMHDHTRHGLRNSRMSEHSPEHESKSIA